MSNVKKSTFIIALATLSVIYQALAADAGNGRIKFTGTVINAPCSIALDSTDINVDLGQVANRVLETGNKYSQSVRYNINLQDCSLTAQGSGGPLILHCLKSMSPSAVLLMRRLQPCWLTPVARKAWVFALLALMTRYSKWVIRVLILI
ncbi:fimbrial protein [Yersinia pseudotuberculosis]|nr:Fimbria A protein precursor [Yersinia pseudotuberculosis]SUP83592.1 fimbrial protein [Yersinia pseudotuberculosis]